LDTTLDLYPPHGDDALLEGKAPLSPEDRMEQENILEDMKLEILSLKVNSWAESNPLSCHTQ
jgi:hypothetical protein